MGKKKRQGENKAGRNDGLCFKTRKEQGEWAELCFMARAKALGMGVLKPFGDSRLYDVAVEDGSKIVRVQVKCTMRRGRGGYRLTMWGPGHKRYLKGSIDFFAGFIVPTNEWYIIPQTPVRGRAAIYIPAAGKGSWARYREAWHLLQEESSGGLELHGCADPDFEPAESAMLNDYGAGISELGT